jgi:hypothetical protein
MDPIEIEYSSMDVVPEAVKGLYTEKDGKAVLTGVNGLKTQADVDTVREALRKEREDHDKVKVALKPWQTLGKYDEISEKISKFDTYKAAAEGKIDETKIEALLQPRLAQKIQPLEAALREKEELLAAKDKEVNELRGSLTTRDMKEIIRTAANKSKMHPTAIADAELVAERMMEFDENRRLVTKAGLDGITAGIDVDAFMKTMFKQRPHWWPESEGGGAGGGGRGGGFGGKNPWSADHWSLTEQGKVLSQEGRDRAESMAKAAGSFIGATSPKKKT